MLRKGYLETRGMVVGGVPIPVGRWRRDASGSSRVENPHLPQSIIIGRDTMLAELRERMPESDFAAVWVAKQWLSDLTAQPGERKVFDFQVLSEEQKCCDSDGNPWIIGRNPAECVENGTTKVVVVPHHELPGHISDRSTLTLPVFYTAMIRQDPASRPNGIRRLYPLTVLGFIWNLPEDLQDALENVQRSELLRQFITNSLILTPETRFGNFSLYENSRCIVIPPPSILRQSTQPFATPTLAPAA